ncbi:MAG: zinc ABC transporter substrate-binding protein, partial [Arcobacteraceae bacterium]|nr:zinc ABC transporter substrate-binding protein [Arcobacteraceae bacterium]
MLKKILVIVLLFLGSFLYANVNVVVSILPQVSITKAIGQDKVNVEVMVKPGNSPHTYEPKPSQMKAITSADLYFSIDVEFEKSWLPKFINQNKIMQVINISQGVEKYKIHNTIDPHIWTTPQNIKILAT